MAKKVVMVDDLTDEIGDDVTTVQFGWEGEQLEIDLSADNRARLADFLAEFVAASRPAEEPVNGQRQQQRRTPSRPAGKVARSRTPARTSVDREQLRHIREWAKSEGLSVADRGKIPDAVMVRFQEAHQ